MAKIVAVHGVGHQFKGESSIHAEWWPAINDGLLQAGCSPLAGDEVACAFYGDLFRDAGSKSSGDPPLDVHDIGKDWEAHLLAAWAQTREPSDLARSPNKGPAWRGLQGLLDRALRLPFFAGLTERLLILDLKQLRSYLHTPELRKTIQGRITRCVSADTRILIGHSLGSIVAYEAACSHREWPLRAFVTLGSPLGTRNLVFDRLIPAPVGGRGVFPGGVDVWTNIVDQDDPAALPKRLSELFGPEIRDRLVSNGARAHDATHYLSAVETGQAIAEGLR